MNKEIMDEEILAEDKVYDIINKIRVLCDLGLIVCSVATMIIIYIKYRRFADKEDLD